MARDPKASFKFTTIGSGAGSITASADKLSANYQLAATPSGVQIISDVYVNFTETIADAVRFGAQADVAGTFAQPLIMGSNGQNQLVFLKAALRGISVTGVTSATFAIVGDSQPAVTFTASSANVSGTFAAAFVANTPVQFLSSGVLPPELAPNQTYYVVGTPTTSVFTVAATVGGTAIVMSGTGTGTHQVVQVGVPSTATTLADRSLKNTQALTPAVVIPLTGSWSTLKFPPLLTNNRAMQLQFTIAGSTAGGNILVNMAGIVNGRDGSMGVSF
jgi:hypothetical protein